VEGTTNLTKNHFSVGSGSEKHHSVQQYPPPGGVQSLDFVIKRQGASPLFTKHKKHQKLAAGHLTLFFFEEKKGSTKSVFRRCNLLPFSNKKEKKTHLSQSQGEKEALGHHHPRGVKFRRV